MRVRAKRRVPKAAPQRIVALVVGNRDDPLDRGGVCLRATRVELVDRRNVRPLDCRRAVDARIGIERDALARREVYHHDAELVVARDALEFGVEGELGCQRKTLARAEHLQRARARSAVGGVDERLVVLCRWLPLDGVGTLLRRGRPRIERAVEEISAHELAHAARYPVARLHLLLQVQLRAGKYGSERHGYHHHGNGLPAFRETPFALFFRNVFIYFVLALQRPAHPI